MNFGPKPQTSAQPTTGPTFRPSISDLLPVTLGTLVGYISAFSYHREYTMAFGIPPDLISFNPGSLLVAAYNIWTFVLSSGAFIVGMYLIIGQPKTPFDARMQRIMPITFFLAIWVGLYESPTIRRWAIILFFSMLYYEFVRPLLRYKNVKGYAQKLQKADEESFFKREPQLRIPFLTLLLVVTVISLGGFAGRSVAHGMDKFLVLADRPNFIVPTLYADKLIAVRVDRKTRRLLPEIIVIVYEPGKPVALRWDKIGTLSLVSNP